MGQIPKIYYFLWDRIQIYKEIHGTIKVNTVKIWDIIDKI